MKTFKALVGYAFIVCLLSFASFAQTASISGTVSDTSGAVVPGALVTVRNVSTNATRITTSGATGAYALTELPVGTYDVSVQQKSFKVFRVPGLQLSVAQALTVNAQLEPGAVTEELQVRADLVPDVDLENSQISNLVDERQMKDLPLITRDPYSLVLLSPGTSQTDSSNGGFSINGGRDRNNNFLLDGVDNNDTSVPGIPDGVLAANPDSTEEFRVITDNFNAEFGRNTGAIIDVVTKSGTNSFHGDVYEFGRWNGFGGARDWFNPAIDASGQPSRMNPYVRNQFGGSIGGPIVKDKTFFFFNEEMDRFRTTLTNASTVPTAAFKTGVFTYISPTGPVPVNLLPGSPQNINNLPEDPTMKAIFALYPNPTVSNGDGYSGTLFFPSTSALSSYNSTAKLDQHFTDRETLSLRFGYDHSYDPNSGHGDFLPGGVGEVHEKAIGEGLSAQLTSALRNNLVNNLQFGWNHVYAKFSCGGLNTIDSSTFNVLDSFGYGRDYIMDPFTSMACFNDSDYQFRETGTISYTESLSWVKGAHTWKFGFDFRDVGETGPDNFGSRRQVQTNVDQFVGGPFFSPIAVTDSSGNILDTQKLDDAASAFYGFVIGDNNSQYFDKTGTRKPTDNKFFRQHEFDFYAQDAWKIRRNLTLSFGLRYQLNGVPYEQNGNFSNLLTNPASFPVVFSIVGPGTGKSMYQPDYKDIEPRAGFSWDPKGDGKTAIRGAFGIFHDRIFGNLFENARGNPPFEQDYVNNPIQTINNAITGGAYFGLEAALPTSPFFTQAPTQVPSATVADGSLLAPTILDPHFRMPASNNWNFGVQRQLPGNNAIDIAYVGAMGVHVWSHRDGNPPDPALVQQLVTYCSNPANAFGCTPATVSGISLYEGADVFGDLPFNAVAHNALVQPAYQETEFNSIYHGLQTKFTHRMSHGLQVQGSYTWSHSIDNGVDPLTPAGGSHTFPRNSLNLAENRGNSDNDIRHVAVINYIWELPLGRGRSYLSNGVVGKILEGMQFSGITTLQTGHPFQVRSTQDSERTGVGAWATQVGNPFGAPSSPACAPAVGAGYDYISNVCAFELPAFGGPGGTGRNEFYGPGFVDFDLAFSKKMKVTERVQAELRVESFNIFNHPHFQNPGTDSANVGNLIFGDPPGGANPLFGVITNTVGQPDGTTSARQMQVALRLSF